MSVFVATWMWADCRLLFHSMLVVIVVAVVSHWHALFIADWYELKSYLLLSIIYKSARDDGNISYYQHATLEMEFRHLLRSKWRRCSSGNSIVDIPLRRWRRCRRQRRRWQRWWWQRWYQRRGPGRRGSDGGHGGGGYFCFVWHYWLLVIGSLDNKVCTSIP